MIRPKQDQNPAGKVSNTVAPCPSSGTCDTILGAPKDLGSPFPTPPSLSTAAYHSLFLGQLYSMSGVFLGRYPLVLVDFGPGISNILGSPLKIGFYFCSFVSDFPPQAALPQGFLTL